MTCFPSLSTDRLLLCTPLAIALAFSSPGSAQQQSDSGATSSTPVSNRLDELPIEVPGSESSIKLGYTETNDAERHDALLEDAHRQIRGGRIGLVLSALAFGSGVGLLPFGLIGRGLCEEDDDCGNGWIAASSALIVSGVIGMGVSGNVLQKGKRKKRNLETKRVETALRLSPTSASVALHF